MSNTNSVNNTASNNNNNNNLYQSRQAELVAIGAIQLPDDCIDAMGKVTYHPMLKGVKNGSIDSLMKSIVDIYKVPEGFKGTCANKRGVHRDFSIDVPKENIKGFGGYASAKVDHNGPYGRMRLTINNKSIAFSRLLACLNLLVSGYRVDDWNILQVNHKDNSAGIEYFNHCWVENIDLENLELFIKQDVNGEHYRTWQKLYTKIGILSSFSAYNNRFIAYINRLEQLERLKPEYVSKWKYTQNPFNGVVHFE